MKRGIPPTHYSEPAVALFRQQWRMYRKVIENNCLFHREAYEWLHRILVNEVIEPFRFLDIACDDASATLDALKGTRVAHYRGIDLCRPPLDLASKTLEILDCPVTLANVTLSRRYMIGLILRISHGLVCRRSLFRRFLEAVARRYTNLSLIRSTKC